MVLEQLLVELRGLKLSFEIEAFCTNSHNNYHNAEWQDSLDHTYAEIVSAGLRCFVLRDSPRLPNQSIGQEQCI